MFNISSNIICFKFQLSIITITYITIYLSKEVLNCRIPFYLSEKECIFRSGLSFCRMTFLMAHRGSEESSELSPLDAPFKILYF